MNCQTVTNRHDFLLLFEVTNGNPNGDPDAGNLPRLDPNTNRGIVSDVCLKRKVRNYVELFPRERENDTANGYNVLIKQGAVIEKEQKQAIKAAKDNDNTLTGASVPERAKNWLCREFYDVRTFGGVLSTGDDVMKGSAFGQVRGPVQFTFGQSFHSITPLEVTITRCAVTKEEDAKKERTMGNKHIVPYALYAAKGYVSPAFAERTGFTEADLELMFEAVLNMFEHDRSAARGEMIVRGLYDFEHVGTQHPNNAEQNRREARLGCCHAHKLFEGITNNVKLREGKTSLNLSPTTTRNSSADGLKTIYHLVSKSTSGMKVDLSVHDVPNDNKQMSAEDLLVPLSALAQMVYCPRRCALIHVEQTFEENLFTVRGRLAHRRADEPENQWETRPDGTRVRVARAVSLVSERLGLVGRADVVEFPDDSPPYPVEFKSGRRKRRHWRCDDVQLCGQALCLEEMLSDTAGMKPAATPVMIPRGAIYHIASRRRREVVFDEELRALTLRTIEAVRELLLAQRVPPPVFDRRCPDCSLIEVCMPQALQERESVERAYRKLWEVTS